jgi:hypothetical protein
LSLKFLLLLAMSFHEIKFDKRNCIYRILRWFQPAWNSCEKTPAIAYSDSAVRVSHVSDRCRLSWMRLPLLDVVSGLSGQPGLPLGTVHRVVSFAPLCNATNKGQYRVASSFVLLRHWFLTQCNTFATVRSTHACSAARR